MERDKKPLTAQEKIEMDLMAEAELQKLQRQYRIMESDRKAFAEETSIKVAKQRQVINTLKKEQLELLTDLRVTLCNSNKRKDLKLTSEFNELLDNNETYDSTIFKEKTHLEEINKQILKLEKRVNDLRSKDVTDLEYENRVRSGEKYVKTLENQLGTEINRFCSVLSKNRALREEIDHLLKERLNFNTVWEKLLENLNQGKKQMLDLIEQATLAYDQREEWCSKLHALRFRSKNDLLLHGQEMKELQRQLDHDRKLYDFLGVKGQKRVMKDLIEKETKKKDMQKEEEEKKTMQHQDMIKEIQTLVKEDDLNRLSAQYIKQEEENFALFNYVNELNHEIELITEDIEHLYESIAHQKELNELRLQQQKETVDSLNEDLQQATDEANQGKTQLEEAEKGLKDLLNEIDALFNLIQCDNTPILQLLGTETTINNHNVMLYLGILEKKVGELTANMYLKEKNLANKKRKSHHHKEEKLD